MSLPRFASPSSVDGRLGCFYLLAAVNKIVMNTDVQTSVQDAAFSSFGSTCGSRIVGLYADSIFNYLRKCHTVFHKTMRHLQGSTERERERNITSVPSVRAGFSMEVTVELRSEGFLWRFIERDLYRHARQRAG